MEVSNGNNIEQNINSVKENRKAEAKRKNLSNKLLMIVRTKGFSITDFATDFATIFDQDCDLDFSQNENIYKYDPDGYSDESDIPTREGMQYSRLIGYSFDALSLGCNLQITYLLEEDNNLKVTFNGYTVYEEEDGDLVKYLPNEAWESKIDHWAKSCPEKLKILQKKQKAEEEKEKKLFLDKVFKYLKETWGV